MLTLYAASPWINRSLLFVSSAVLVMSACSSDVVVPDEDADDAQGGQGGQEGQGGQGDKIEFERICPTESQDIWVGHVPGGIFIIDLDADGDLDVVTSRFGSNDGEINIVTPTALINDGLATFEESHELGELTRAAATVKFMGDLDNKGGVDAVIYRGDPKEVQVLTSSADGDFTLLERLDDEVSAVVAFEDFDGDGSIDILATPVTYDELIFLKNQGDGHFIEQKRLPFSARDFQAAEDIDQDGDVDLLIDGQFKLNDGDASFEEDGLTIPESSDPTPHNWRFADLDGDKVLDAVGFDSYKNSVKIYFQVNGNLDSPGLPLLTIAWEEDDVTDLILADMNDDGFKDIVVAVDDGITGGRSEIWLNEGEKHFQQKGTRWLLSDSPSAQIDVGDLNGDGLLDLYEGNGNDNTDSSDSVYLFREETLQEGAECPPLPGR